ncbi:TraR/DksA C4-type zinc finger protein (plasmid) [Rhizobium sp. CB3090]|uniref:TraR/DksA family transcriptional regulator n=1 Tax=Rhizobium sp. CB3090 TaxID=3039156 RepID=UPI0024B24F9D|nr:TraR/DksA C4-type zinc finger protein [Rhizobium sp. CB3090]WFU11806.1 TraR/DksA C4-type zinc finger protein [Rhizobium sp. CB3090]
MNIEHFRQNLETRRRSIEQRLGAIDNDISQPLDDDSDERAVELENEEVLAQLERSGREELRAIMAALSRIDNGQYGKCVLCDAPISEKRLEALPFTPYCVDCARDQASEAS